MRQTPHLYRSGLTGKVYVVTKYTEGPGGLVVADEKFDVTDDFNVLAEQAVHDVADALRLTVEYVGTGTLPPIEGWSWYDALRKHAPHMLTGFTLPHVYREGDRIRDDKGTGYSDRVTDEQIKAHLADPEESWPGSHAFGHAVLRLRAQERAAAESAQAPLPEAGWRCPVHDQTDCSPLLNGCDRVIEHYRS